MNRRTKFLLITLFVGQLFVGQCVLQVWAHGQGANTLGPSQSTDSDGDGLPDSLEQSIGTDPNDSDTDFDGISDGWEYYNGLNPLVYSTSTGEAPKFIVGMIAITSIGTAVTFVVVYKTKKNAKDKIDIDTVRRYTVLFTCIFFAILLLLSGSFMVHGPEDPGPNVVFTTFDESETIEFHVQRSQFYQSRVRVEVSCQLPYDRILEAVVHIIHPNGTIIHNATLLVTRSSSGFVAYDAVTWSLEYENYTIEVSEVMKNLSGDVVEDHTYVKLEATQIWKDGRNTDQKTWDEVRAITRPIAFAAPVIGGLFFICNGNSIRDRRYYDWARDID